ncbi:MAG: DUF4397 domain-containing protein [Bacteroidota bacterium]
MRNRNYRLGTIILGLAVSVILFLTSCVDDQDVPEPIEHAHVSIYHGSPDLEGINIRVSTGQINETPFEYDDYFPYLNFFPGERYMKFIESDLDVVTLIDTTFTFEIDHNYSVFVANTASNLEAVLIEDIFPASIAGKAMVRFIHMSPDAPAVNVLANEDELFGTTIFTEGSEFLPIDAGRTTFEFIEEALFNTVIQLPEVQLTSGGYYNIILSGFDNPPAGNTNELKVDVVRL